MKTQKININPLQFIIKDKNISFHKLNIIFNRSIYPLFIRLKLSILIVWILTAVNLYIAFTTDNLKESIYPISIGFLGIYLLINHINKIYRIIEKKEKEADIILENMFFILFDIKNKNVNDILLLLNDIVLKNKDDLSKISNEEIKLRLKTEIFKHSGELNENNKNKYK